MDRLQTYFSRKLLPHIVNELVLDQFANTEDLPGNMASQTIRFFRKRQASNTDVQTLTEGTAISTYTQIPWGHVDCLLKQRGEATKVTDVLRAVDLYKPLTQNIETIGEDAALDFDTIVRNAILANPAGNVDTTQVTLYGSNTGFERFSGVTNTLVSATDFTSLAALSAAQAKITRLSALGCATKLKTSKVPMINGNYVAVICPEQMHDIRQDTDWLTAATRVQAGRALYKREVVELDGVRYIEHNNPMRETVYGTPLAATVASTTDTVYSALFLGRGAYGAPNLTNKTAGSSPYKPQIIINDKPDKSDPLNQFCTAGWKAFYGSVLLWPKTSTGSTASAADMCPFVVALRTKSTFV